MENSNKRPEKTNPETAIPETVTQDIIIPTAIIESFNSGLKIFEEEQNNRLEIFLDAHGSEREFIQEWRTEGLTTPAIWNKAERFCEFVSDFNNLGNQIIGMTGLVFKKYRIYRFKLENGKDPKECLEYVQYDVFEVWEYGKYDIGRAGLDKYTRPILESPDFQEFISKIDPSKRQLITDSISTFNSQLAEMNLDEYRLPEINIF